MIYLTFQVTQPKDKLIPHDIPGMPWRAVDADIFMLNNKAYLCIVDYHYKFLVVKQTDGLSTHNPINTGKIIFSEYKLPRKILLMLAQIFSENF